MSIERHDNGKELISSFGDMVLSIFFKIIQARFTYFARVLGDNERGNYYVITHTSQTIVHVSMLNALQIILFYLT